MKKRLTISQITLFGFIISLLIVVTSPFWLWQLKQDTPLNMLIMGDNERTTGLIWLLNNERAENYSTLSGSKALSSEHKVYYVTNQENELQIEQVQDLEKALIHTGDKTLISEYDTLINSSTEIREKIENLVNIHWDGWAGKYFSDLNSSEVPSWVKGNYTSEWAFKGHGIVLVHSDGYVIVLSEMDLQGEGLAFQFTESGRKLLNSNLNATYKNWFNVVESRNNEEVLATYTLPVSKAAKARLAGFGIPVQFPAVVLHQNVQYTSYYFAGDYSRNSDAPGIYQTEGIAWWKQHIGTRDSFYWNAYVPMMKKLLANGLDLRKNQLKAELSEENGLKFNSRTDADAIQIQKNGKWENLIVKGVNMGIAKPGTFPGEAGITKDEYFRWFKAIGDMNANALRIYTLHPPAFYEAFYEYNQLAEKPLYLFHGAWVNEEKLVHHQDAFHPEVTDDFQQEMTYMVDIIHGKASLPERPGHASGEYTYDISPYVLGFIIGIEWDPYAVVNTNEKHKEIAPFSGTYFKTESASPFENWLAQMMDYVATYETENYQWQHTMSFTNWVTTDLLTHPAEPSEEEDLVAVNPNHIAKTEHFHGGLFASYHVYPYYPDFLNYEKKYTDYVDSAGNKNNYAGYLHDLIPAHTMPVLIAEFGVPESRGLTHKNVYGMDQGFHSEDEQGDINKQLFESIVSEGAAGGLLFAWHDEWFKRTWNTMDYDNPDRRPFWSNNQTNEQHFGLLSFEPSVNGTQIYPDGKIYEWEKLRIPPIYENMDPSHFLNAMYVTSDLENMYIRLDYKYPVDLDHIHTQLLFDTIDKQGQTTISLSNGQALQTDFGVDFLVNLSDQQHSRILIDSYYDSFYYQYGHVLQMIPQADYTKEKDNGTFHPIRLALNKELTIPETGEKLPFVSYETGALKFGNGNPYHKDFNSLTDISFSQDRKTLELRLPWALLNMKDPSRKEVIGNLWSSGIEGSETINGIRIAAVVTDQAGEMFSFPDANGGKIASPHTEIYSWENWDYPTYRERIKNSYWVMKEAFSND